MKLFCYLCVVRTIYTHTHTFAHAQISRGEKHKDSCRFLPDSDLQLVFSAEIVPQLAILLLWGFLSTRPSSIRREWLRLKYCSWSQCISEQLSCLQVVFLCWNHLLDMLTCSSVYSYPVMKGGRPFGKRKANNLICPKVSCRLHKKSLLSSS